MTRLYEEGYERGDLPLIIMVAKWLDYRLPGGSVWYGGDSGSAGLTPFDEERRYKLMLHFFDVGHRPYTRKAYFGGKDHQILCNFCGGIPMDVVGTNGQTCFFDRCAGCGKSVISDKITSQILYTLDYGEEFFEANKTLLNNGMIQPSKNKH